MIGIIYVSFDFYFTKKINDLPSLCRTPMVNPAQIFKYIWIYINWLA